MERETNLDSILALEMQIQEHERAIIQLKRAQNSLLNVSSLLPSEILGIVFRWNVTPDGDFGGVSKGSYNFLLVCHHWFEVALRTQGLWNFWGNSIRNWKHRHARCSTRNGPLDLVLAESPPGHDLDDDLRDALQDRAERDAIRRVHLRGARATGFKSIISAIAVTGEGTRSSNVESFIMQNVGGNDIVDVSPFFSRYHLLKLKCLRLRGCWISSWDLLKSRTVALTTLELTTIKPSPIPTPSQLLSIFLSNPLIQEFTLSSGSPPRAVGSDQSSTLVPLRHLKKLSLTCGFRHAFGLLNHLELPDKAASLKLFLSRCPTTDLSQTLGSYLGGLVGRRGRYPGGGLGLFVSRHSKTFSLLMRDAREGGDYDCAELDWFVQVSAAVNTQLKDEEANRLCFDLLAHIPLEWVIYLQTTFPILRSQELCINMCNLTQLHLHDVDLSTWFAESDTCGPPRHKEPLRDLDHIEIIRPILRGDWTPLTNFLSRRAAAGNQISSLELSDHPHIDKDAVESIERAVKVFRTKTTIERTATSRAVTRRMTKSTVIASGK